MPEAKAPILCVQNLVKVLGAITVLKDVSFTVEEGSVVAIIGSSGSGKSTLLRCLNMLVAPDDGDILWKNQSVIWRDAARAVRKSERELLSYRTEIGMVFQSYNLFPHLTALENVIEAPLMVRKRPREEVVREAQALLTKVRLSHRVNAYPAQMSGGEQQRVAIARALAMQPRALLFDEVTSALDPELKGEVLTVMRELAAEGMTMILVSHEMGFVSQVSDKVIFMSKGVMAESGHPADVLKNPQTPELRSFLKSVSD